MKIEQIGEKVFLLTPAGVKIEITRLDASALNELIERV